MGGRRTIRDTSKLRPLPTTGVSMPSMLRIRVSIATLAMLAAGAFYAGPASAAPASSESVPTTTATTVPMTLVGYDADVAKRNGFKIVVGPNGKLDSVPIGSTSKGLANYRGASKVPLISPVPGDCGSSRVVILDDGRGRAAVSTGFTLYRGAISYGWSVDVLGGGGSYRKNFGGGLANRTTWTGSFAYSIPRTGTYYASVPKSSFAILNNGGYCTSGGPSDSEFIYR